MNWEVKQGVFPLQLAFSGLLKQQQKEPEPLKNHQTINKLN